MSLKVPYLTEAAIEASATALLAAYARKQGIEIRPPVPVEEILEDHLGLHLGFDDLCSRLGKPDVLGALWIEDGEVLIDQTLDPDEQPSALGRYRFTVAHEVGHWELHRRHLEFQRLQDDLFKERSEPSIVCRTSQQKERIELQADAFAGALLMPRDAVADRWCRLIGPERLEVGQLCDRGRAAMAEALSRRGRGSIDPRAQQNELIEFALRPMAKAFKVSPRAMRIRLERLGCIVRDVDATVPLFGAG